MGLGPQCWTCRSRRVRCTSEQPSCQKCDDRALVCAGYGPTKPVRWKQPTCKDAPPGRVVSQVSSQGSSPTLDVLMKREVPERESVSLPTSIELSPEMRIVIYAMQYHNDVLAQDLVPVDSPFNPIRFRNGSSWMGGPKCMFIIHVCIMSYNQAWKRVPWAPQDRLRSMPAELLQPAAILVPTTNRQDIAFQQRALQIVQKRLANISAKRDAGFLSYILALIALQLQRSAFFGWSMHLAAAQSLVAELGGLSGMAKDARVTDFDKYHLTTTLVFAATTTPTRQLCVGENYFHQVSAVLESLDFDMSQTATPFPLETFGYLSAVTEVRGRCSEQTDTTLSRRVRSLIEHIRCFDSRTWAEDVVRRTSEALNSTKFDIEYIIRGYILVTEAMKEATVLYALRSLFADPLSHGAANKDMLSSEASLNQLANFTNQTYQELCRVLHEMFERKSAGDTFWKFCLWPIVVAGQQTVYYQDEREKDFLCWELHNMSRSLGAGAMQDGAYLISHMFTKQKEANTLNDQTHGHERKLTWDEFFKDSPLFMM